MSQSVENSQGFMMAKEVLSVFEKKLFGEGAPFAERTVITDLETRRLKDVMTGTSDCIKKKQVYINWFNEDIKALKSVTDVLATLSSNYPHSSDVQSAKSRLQNIRAQITKLIAIVNDDQSAANNTTSTRTVEKDKYIQLVDEMDDEPSIYRLPSLADEFRKLSPKLYPEALKMAGECERLYKEKKNSIETSDYDAAVKKLKKLENENEQSPSEWNVLANTFDGLDYKDSAQLSQKCKKKVASLVAKANNKQAMAKAVRNIGTLIQLVTASTYMYILFATDVVRQHFSAIQADFGSAFNTWGKEMWFGLFYTSLPIGITSAAIGIISLLFLRKSYRGSGKVVIILLCIAHAVILGAWQLNGELKGVVMVAIATYLCSNIISIPGYLLSGSEK